MALACLAQLFSGPVTALPVHMLLPTSSLGPASTHLQLRTHRQPVQPTHSPTTHCLLPSRRHGNPWARCRDQEQGPGAAATRLAQTHTQHTRKHHTERREGEEVADKQVLFNNGHFNKNNNKGSKSGLN